MAESKQEWRKGPSDKRANTKNHYIDIELNDNGKINDGSSIEQSNNLLDSIAIGKVTRHRIKTVEKGNNGETIIKYESEDGKIYTAEAKNDEWKELLNKQQKESKKEMEEK